MGNTPPFRIILHWTTLSSTQEGPILLSFLFSKPFGRARASGNHRDTLAAGGRGEVGLRAGGLSRSFLFRNCFVFNTGRAAKTDDGTHFLRPATLLTRC